MYVLYICIHDPKPATQGARTRRHAKAVRMANTLRIRTGATTPLVCIWNLLFPKAPSPHGVYTYKVLKGSLYRYFKAKAYTTQVLVPLRDYTARFQTSQRGEYEASQRLFPSTGVRLFSLNSPITKTVMSLVLGVPAAGVELISSLAIGFTKLF